MLLLSRFWHSLRVLEGVAQWIKCQPVDPQGHHFGSWSEHIPGLWARSPVGSVERQPVNVSLTYRCFSPSLSSSFPLSKNRYNLFLKKVSTEDKGYYCIA